jgi:hypothetical protein
VPVLRIAIGLRLGVELDVLDAALPSMGFRLPGIVQQLHVAEFLQRDTAPTSNAARV